MPAFARRSFRRWFQDRAAPSAGGERVLLWPDTFNNHFRPDTAIAATRLLESAGYSVAIPDRPLCCGRPLYDWGFLDEAKALWEESFAALKSEIEQRSEEHTSELQSLMRISYAVFCLKKTTRL